MENETPQQNIFRVVAYDNAGRWDYKTEWVTAKEAMDKAKELCGPGADTSNTTIVRIIDQGDFTNLEWTRESGIVFPKP